MSAAMDVSQSFEQEGARVLAEIEAMSQENATWRPLGDMPHDPWRATYAARAIERLTRLEYRVAGWPSSEPERAVRALFAQVPDVTHFDVTHALTRPPTERHGDQSRFVKPLRVGSKPADLNYADVVDAKYPENRENRENRLSLRTPDGAALASRLWDKDPVFGLTPSALVRTTHRKVHEALAGDDTSWCKWCTESGR